MRRRRGAGVATPGAGARNGIAPCPHRPPCPGCPRYGERGAAPGTWAQLLALAREAGIAEPRLVEGAASGFRHRARLMVRGRTRSPKIGLFQQGTHRIVDIPSCPIHHPLINEAAAAARAAIRATGAAPYADLPHTGRVRALQLVVERASRTVQVVVVAREAELDGSRALAERLRDSLGERLHSLWWNGNPERSNVVLGPLWHRFHGPEAVRERIGGAEVFFPPGAFGQSHLELADAVVAHVHARIPDAVRVTEFHAGCGAIGLGQLRRLVYVSCDVGSLRRDAARLAGPGRGLRLVELAAFGCFPYTEHVESVALFER